MALSQPVPLTATTAITTTASILAVGLPAADLKSVQEQVADPPDSRDDRHGADIHPGTA
jgi:hypothetical protein